MVAVFGDCAEIGVVRMDRIATRSTAKCLVVLFVSRTLEKKESGDIKPLEAVKLGYATCLTTTNARRQLKKNGGPAQARTGDLYRVKVGVFKESSLRAQA